MSVFFYVTPSGEQLSAPLACSHSLVEGGYIERGTPVWVPGCGEWRTAEEAGVWVGAAPTASAAAPAPAPATEAAPAAAPSALSPAAAAAVAAAEASEEKGGGGGGAAAAAKPLASRKRERADGGSGAWVYVSGLPSDVSEEEVLRFFKVAGIVKLNYEDSTPKLRLYRDAEGRAKGDAVLCFLKEPSVDLAVSLLDGALLRPGGAQGGWPLSVQPAQFEAKGGGGRGGGGGGGGGGRARAPAAPRAPADRAAKIREAGQRALLSWAEGDDGFVADGSEGMRIVALKNLFDPAEGTAGGAHFFEELEVEVAGELEAACGAIEKVTVFPRHAQGVMVVKFSTPAAAATCLNTVNGRAFGGRTVAAQLWAGEDFSEGRAEGEEEEARRLAEFGKWLEEQK
jgi:HIV Tat-specific factor 1